jgi:DNA-binding Lrp family transcriptional regulator
MSRQFIRWPGYLEGVIPQLEPSALKILAYLFTVSFYNENGYSTIYYSSQDIADILEMSKSSVTSKIKYLHDLGIIEREGKQIFLSESGSNVRIKSKPDLLSPPKVQKMNVSPNKVQILNGKSTKNELKSSNIERNSSIRKRIRDALSTY